MRDASVSMMQDINGRQKESKGLLCSRIQCADDRRVQKTFMDETQVSFNDWKAGNPISHAVAQKKIKLRDGRTKSRLLNCLKALNADFGKN